MIKATKIDWSGGHRLRVRFSRACPRAGLWPDPGGTEGERDFAAMVGETGPMIEPLRDPAYFGRVFLEDGAPTWPNGFDLAPNWLHSEMQAEGTLSHTALVKGRIIPGLQNSLT